MSGHDTKGSSISRVEANRRNAQKSTGPRTLEGKATSRWNAFKHGLLAKEVVIARGHDKENRREFENLLANLREDLQPEGVLEEMQVEKVASCYWRLRRVLQCELGMIKSRREKVRLTRMNESDYIDFDPRTSAGIYHRLALLRVVKERVEKPGYFCANEMDALARAFGREHDLTRRCCVLFKETAEAKQEESANQGSSRANSPTLSSEEIAKFKAAILAEVDKEEEDLQLPSQLAAYKENLELEAELAPLYLPSAAGAEIVLRYETAIDRQIYRAMDQLERLQRQRRGELVPPPVKIQVSGG